MTTNHRWRSDTLFEYSNRMDQVTRFYAKHLDTLRDNAKAWPNSEKALHRYQRLSRRFKQEVARMCAQADALMAT